MKDQHTGTQYTVLKYRLYPTPEQTEQIEKTFGCCRYLWNRMLLDVEEFYAATDLQYIPTPARYKKEAPFLKEVDSQPLCTVHQNLRRAFLDFFRNPRAFQYPRLKTKKARQESFTTYCRQYRTGPTVYVAEKGVHLPKTGLIRAKVHRRPLHWWSLRSATVSKTRSGKYFCSVVFACPRRRPEAAAPTADNTLGLHYAATRFYVDSAGQSPRLPAHLAQAMKKLGRMQQKLCRMERGSNHYQKQLQRIRLQHEHIANQRRDFIHKESRRIANAWEAVCVRNADLKAPGQRGRRAENGGFGLFRECLKYKLERQGKAYIPVEADAPVAKTCHVCGAVNGALSSRETHWTCPRCGAELPRGTNAARNLRDMGLRHFYSENRETGAA